MFHCRFHDTRWLVTVFFSQINVITTMLLRCYKMLKNLLFLVLFRHLLYRDKNPNFIISILFSIEKGETRERTRRIIAKNWREFFYFFNHHQGRERNTNKPLRNIETYYKSCKKMQRIFIFLFFFSSQRRRKNIRIYSHRWEEGGGAR